MNIDKAVKLVTAYVGCERESASHKCWKRRCGDCQYNFKYDDIPGAMETVLGEYLKLAGKNEDDLK